MTTSALVPIGLHKLPNYLKKPLMFSEGNLVTGIPVAEGEPFDLNGDRFVNQMDIDVWLAESANEAGYGLPFRVGDTELDRDVDITDFNTLASNFDPEGATSPTSTF